MSVRTNMEKLNSAREMVKSHCMCFELQDTRTHFIVIYPPGDFAVGGVRVPRSALGLELALSKMEQHWISSYPSLPVTLR